MKIKFYLMLFFTVILLQGCAGKIKTVAAPSLMQKVDYDGMVISDKKHSVNIANYTEVKHIKEKIIFNLIIKNRGQDSFKVSSENITVQFKNKNEDLAPINLEIQPLDDFMIDLENDYFDAEIRIISRIFWDTERTVHLIRKIKLEHGDKTNSNNSNSGKKPKSWAQIELLNNGIKDYNPGKADKARLGKAEIDRRDKAYKDFKAYMADKAYKASFSDDADTKSKQVDQGQSSISMEQRKNIAKSFNARFESSIDHLEKTIRIYEQFRVIVPTLVFKPQEVMPGSTVTGLIVYDTEEIDEKAEGEFNAVISIDGEEHRFVFSRSR